MFCALYRERDTIKDLNYWNVELQEAYFSPVEVNERFKKIKNNVYFHLFVSISTD